MLTMDGAYFARKLLTKLNAETFSKSPACGRCGRRDIEIRRRKNTTWYWRCHNTACKTGPVGRSAWTLDIRNTR